MNEPAFDVYRDTLKRMIASAYNAQSCIDTAVDSLNFYYRDTPTEMLATVYEPCICLIAQGAKTIGMGDDLYGYGTEDYLLASVHMPARVQITEASPEHPYMGLTIRFTMEQIFDILKDLDPVPRSPGRTKRGLYFGRVQHRLLDPVVRLVRLLDTPESIPIMAPLILKEILYAVMQDEGGDFIRQYVMDGSASQRVVQAITRIKENYKAPLNVGELARAVSLSESSLYHNFKKITALSPLQFQKQLRLHEARQLLLTRDIEAAQVAYEVGYESPSQFSREYARMFGLPPKADTQEAMKR